MFKNSRSVASFAFISLLFAAPAFAQFEVSPDHFDAAPPKATQKVQHAKTVHKTTATKRPASGVGKPGKRVAKKKTPGQTVSAKNKTTL
jgi:hypothetical protein